MRLAVVLEHRFDRTPDGAVWTHVAFARSFWRRYLDVFEEVLVVARVRDVSAPVPGAQRADGPCVTFAPVPSYVGPSQYLRRIVPVRRAVRSAVLGADAVLLRVPSVLAAAVVPELRRRGRPYGVEVVGDPYDVFAPGAARTTLRPMLRRWFAAALRGQCAGASAAAYVTAEALQRRYPPGPAAFTTHYSSIELPAGAIVAAPQRPRADGPLRLVTVGTLAQLYKGQDVLLEAVARGVASGADLELDIVGDGGYRHELQARAAALGLGQRVRFLGQLPAGAAVRAVLDAADLFVLASRQEGLPRAMIEAMARGLPCIGTTVGGIPELLPAEALVPPNDAGALATSIAALAGAPDRRAALAEQNLRKAQEFSEDRLVARREAFYRALRARTLDADRERAA